MLGFVIIRRMNLARRWLSLLYTGAHVTLSLSTLNSILVHQSLMAACVDSSLQRHAESTQQCICYANSCGTSCWVSYLTKTHC